MGFLDEIFDTKIADEKDTRINYKPMELPKVKFPSVKKNTLDKVKKAKESEKRESKLKECATWVYINSVEWCTALKNTHIHEMCMNEIFDNLEFRKGTLCSDFIDTLDPDWGDYWYDGSNHKNYTKQQLRRVEKEFDNGRESEELVYEMLQYVWFGLIPKDMLYEEIDDHIIYKLRVRWLA